LDVLDADDDGKRSGVRTAGTGRSTDIFATVVCESSEILGITALRDGTPGPFPKEVLSLGCVDFVA
jgi:hypothetical protein